MLDLIAGNAAAEAVLSEGARVLGIHVRDWLAKPENIDTNAIAQPLLCLTELATWTALRERIATPLAFAGYSIGEVASYACAGALDTAELARLACLRATLMDEASTEPGGLVALRGLSRCHVESLAAKEGASIAIAIADDAFVLGGSRIAMDRIADIGQARGAQITCLKVGIAAHTPLLQPAVPQFKAALESSLLRAPAVPVIAGIDGSWITSREKAIATVSTQIATTIEWARVLQTLYERGARVFVELGPGNALTRIVRERFPDGVVARSVSEFRSIDGVAAWLQRHVE